MNKIIYNYKFHVEEVRDGRTVSGLLDIGFYQYWRKSFQLAGLSIPDPKSVPPYKREDAQALLDKTKWALESILMYPDMNLPHGRTVVVSPKSPDKFGRTYINLYVPCRNTSSNHSHLTCSRQGYVFIRVVPYVQYLGDCGFEQSVVDEVLGILEPYDFDK